MSIFLSGKSKMSVRGDFDQHLVQRSNGSVNQVYKHTILEQDAVFRKQVHDLHQLYSVQKQRTLINGIPSNEFDGYSSWKYATQSSMATPMHQSFGKETQIPFFLMQETRSKEMITQGMSEGNRHMQYKRQHKSIDLQLPADQYISYVDDGPLDLKLSLSLGVGNRRKESAKRTCFDKKTHSSPVTIIDLEKPNPRTTHCPGIVVIDLEESTESVKDIKHVPFFGFAAPVANIRGKQETRVSILSGANISGSVKKDPSQDIAESSCVVDLSGDDRRPNFLTGGDHADAECKNSLSKKQRVMSFEGVLLDLNKAQPDDSSSYMTYPPSADNYKEQTGKILEVFSSTTFSKSDYSSNENSGVFHQEDAAKIPRLNSGQGSCEMSIVEDSTVLSSDISQNAGPIDNSQNVGPIVSDGDSCSLKTMQSGTDLRNLDSPASHKLSESSELKQQEPCKKEKTDQINVLIQVAAESLIHISQNDAPFHGDTLSKVGPNGNETQKMARPQISADSYELIALNLTESNEDDYCVSSKILESNAAEKQDYSSKLRRGRRLKDFQKDILPGLACLSRCEIHEDINILEGVLRSREYRKMRGGNWCAPVRSRRSRLSGRR